MKGQTELEKSKTHIIVEIVEYIPNSVVSKTILRKTSGNVTVSSFALGEEQAERSSPYDNYIQIIDGTAEIIIREKKYTLKLGEGIVIPANTPYCFNANEQFKNDLYRYKEYIGCIKRSCLRGFNYPLDPVESPNCD